jgi:putrescine aminotransferase
MTSMPARNTTSWWRESDTRHHMHPFTDTKGLAEAGGARIITSAEGVTLTDSEGNKLLDGMAGLWCVNVGYGRKALAEAAYQQMLELPYYNTFFNTATPSSVELAEKLAEITPAGLNHVFFGSSGSEANDTIARAVRHFWNLEARPTKKTFISRTHAYHGSTMASISLGGMAAMHGQADLPLPGFVHVMPPYWYDFGGDLSPEAFGLEAARAVEDKILELGADNVAAFIGEPIMGAGAVIIPPESYWPEVQRICRKHDVLLIVDEVICGFGRTGHIMIGDRVADTLISKGGEFYHGFTYSGHPVACAVALANIKIIEDENLVQRSHDETGPHLARRLAELAEHPIVGEVRSLGLIGAVEMVKDKASRSHFDDIGATGTICRDHCIAGGVILRAVRDTMVMSPALTITTAEIDRMIDILHQALDRTAKDVGLG